MKLVFIIINKSPITLNWVINLAGKSNIAVRVIPFPEGALQRKEAAAPPPQQAGCAHSGSCFSAANPVRSQAEPQQPLAPQMKRAGLPPAPEDISQVCMVPALSSQQGITLKNKAMCFLCARTVLQRRKMLFLPFLRTLQVFTAPWDGMLVGCCVQFGVDWTGRGGIQVASG